MAHIEYVPKKFTAEHMAIIDAANGIIASWTAQGYDLTLRQLYYQFVARGLIPNKQTEYKRLGTIISDGRLAGLIDWAAIVDRTREVEKPSTWSSPEQIVEIVADQYQIDLWKNQPFRPEVWVEKEALVVARAAGQIGELIGPPLLTSEDLWR